MPQLWRGARVMIESISGDPMRTPSLKTHLRQDIQQRLAAVREQITSLRPMRSSKPRKAVYRCGKCKGFGHNARTCPKGGRRD